MSQYPDDNEDEHINDSEEEAFEPDGDDDEDVALEDDPDYISWCDQISALTEQFHKLAEQEGVDGMVIFITSHKGRDTYPYVEEFGNGFANRGIIEDLMREQEFEQE